MASLVYHAPVRTAAPSALPAGLGVRAARHPAIVALVLAVLLLLIAGVLLAAAASIQTAGRVPHPIPLPAPSAPSTAGS
jgi:hypothetical protein